jgi:hypothetical protein
MWRRQARRHAARIIRPSTENCLARHFSDLVAVTVAIGAFVFRPRQLIGYDRLRSQPA